MRCSYCYEKNVKNSNTASIADNSLTLGTIKMKISSFYDSLNIRMKISRAIPDGMDFESFQFQTHTKFPAKNITREKFHYVRSRRLWARVFAQPFRSMLIWRDVKDVKRSSSFSSTTHPTLVISQTSEKSRHLISQLNRCNKFIIFELFAFFWVKVKKTNLSVSIFTLKKAGRKLWNWKKKKTYTHNFAHRYFLIQMIYLCWQTYLHILVMPATWDSFSTNINTTCVKRAMKSCWLRDDNACNSEREERLSDMEKNIKCWIMLSEVRGRNGRHEATKDAKDTLEISKQDFSQK